MRRGSVLRHRMGRAKREEYYTLDDCYPAITFLCRTSLYKNLKEQVKYFYPLCRIVQFLLSYRAETGILFNRNMFYIPAHNYNLGYCVSCNSNSATNTFLVVQRYQANYRSLVSLLTNILFLTNTILKIYTFFSKRSKIAFILLWSLVWSFNRTTHACSMTFHFRLLMSIQEGMSGFFTLLPAPITDPWSWVMPHTNSTWMHFVSIMQILCTVRNCTSENDKMLSLLLYCPWVSVIDLFIRTEKIKGLPETKTF